MQLNKPVSTHLKYDLGISGVISVIRMDSSIVFLWTLGHVLLGQIEVDQLPNGVPNIARVLPEVQFSSSSCGCWPFIPVRADFRQHIRYASLQHCDNGERYNNSDGRVNWIGFGK